MGIHGAHKGSLHYVILRRLFDRLQIDKTLAYALSTRIWQAVSGPVTIALVVKMLDEDETGVFSVLIGILNIQTLFELGLLNVLIGHAGHAATAIKQADSASPTNREATQAHARMGELIRASRLWFAGASVLFALFSFAIGWYTLTNSDTQTAWQQPLFAIVPIVALTVFFSPSLAILEGSGERELIYRFAFYTRFMGSFAVWMTLLLGFGIWALVVSALVQTLWTGYLPLVHRSSFFKRFGDTSTKSTEFSWTKDVVPAQWRAAAVSASYHFATQYFAIILAAYHTTADAGRLGLTLMVTGAIQMMALAWAQTKFSVISAQHAAGDREGAGTLWRRTALISSSLLILAFAVLTILLTLLPTLRTVLESWGMKDRDLASRFITPTQCAVFGIACLANHFIALQGFYVLARKANPLVVSSVVGFGSTALIVWIGGIWYAIDGIVIGFAIGMALIALPLHTIAYLRFRAHATDSAA
ncbi:MAG: hypothetical protein HKN47_07300 [Pirellulaceae bacterium]|nr:hypothetical protein [Pirellulaceae bacterium]